MGDVFSIDAHRMRMALNASPAGRNCADTRATSGRSHGGTATYGACAGSPPKKFVQHGVSH